jgi:hypothetical protein
MALLNLFRPAKTTAAYQGYIDARSTHHIAGWLRDLQDPARRLDYEIMLDGRVLRAGTANTHSDILVQVGVGDGDYTFHVTFESPLTPAQRDRVFVRPAGASFRLELAPGLVTTPPPAPGTPVYQGYLDERSVTHVAGWVRDLTHPEARVEVEIVLEGPEGERILARMLADDYNPLVQQVGVGDGRYAFFKRFEQPVDEAERDQIFVRPVGSGHRLELSPGLRASFEPINHVAMDIVNNCNLRCPFCVYDYSHTNRTNFMTDETFNAALRLIPFVTDGNFWLSCLHEATLHPQLVEFIARVPRQYRKKLFFTTNLAKRMPLSYFEALADSGMSHINVSLESLDPVLYERMRKGARFKIFMEMWEQLLSVFAAHPNPPKIRYNMMAYRSNLFEIKGLTELLLREKNGYQVEIRNTFDGPQIDPKFRNYEFLTNAEWAFLASEMKGFAPEQVVLLLPPGGEGYDRWDVKAEQKFPERDPYRMPEITPGPAPRPFSLRISWDGTLNVYAELPRAPGDPPTHANYLVSNINALEDPMATLFAL